MDERTALRLDVERALLEIPESYRVPLLLRFQQELAHEEIGQALGISAMAAAQRVHRGKALLRERLSFLRKRSGGDAS